LLIFQVRISGCDRICRVGNEEKEEHEKLATMLEKIPFEKILLLGDLTTNIHLKN